MILVEGEKWYDFTIGDTLYDFREIKSFYISAYEETNAQYRAYLEFLLHHKKTEEYKNALPDTSVWLKEDLLPEEQKYLTANYFRNKEFNDYPVVGISAHQAKKYCDWKTDRLNEMILIREGILDYDTTSGSYFTTDEYLAPDTAILPLADINPSRKVRYEDGILLPRFRLPTIFEWEYAALDMGNKKHEYVVTPKPEKQKKSDKKNRYPFLFTQKKKISFTTLQKKLESIGLIPVYEGEKNNYNVYNLYYNVSELILPDSTFIHRMGGSWKEPDKDYSSFYQACIKCSTAYTPIYKFNTSMNKNKTTSAATGFRVAMDFMGNINHPDMKRRKVK